MKTSVILLPVELRLFDGEGGAAGAGEAGQTGEVNSTSAGTQRTKAGGAGAAGTGASPAEREKGPDAGGGEEKTQTPEERRKAFRQLIEGEYKDLYTQETQRIINQRFKETKALRETLDSYRPVIQLANQRYGVKDGDAKGLMSALENDSAYWNAAAEAAGMSVEDFKEREFLRAQNAALLEAEKARRGEEAAERQYRRWEQEAMAMREQVPDFDLRSETRNPVFVELLRSNMPVAEAYRFVHMEEIVKDAVQKATAETEKRVMDNVRAKGARPVENGTAEQAAFLSKEDVNKMTAAQLDDIARRVARGERIVL